MFPLFLQSIVALLSLTGVVILVRGAGPARAIGLRRRTVRWPLAVLLLLGGLGLGAGIAVPLVTFFAATLVTLVLLGVLVTMLVRRGGATAALLVTALLVAVIVVGTLQPLGLKVLLLPTADSLPYQPVAAAHVVKTYGHGMWFEGIAQGRDGTVYLAESKGENYATGDKSGVHAEVIARAVDGTERVYFTMPKGSTAGVMAISADNTMYVAVTGHQRGLWRITPDGSGRLFAPLPHGSFPNGVTLGPDGTVYVADAALGTIWHIDPTSGAVSRAYSGAILRPRRYIALPPGANGIHYFDGHMYVTNSDSGKLLRFSIGTDGQLTDPEAIVRGVPADDFAIDTDGTVYLTTHIYNTIVRVAPDGTRTVIANTKQHIIGATDCILVTDPAGTKTLYAVTDGGALATGNKNAAGTLVALTIANP